MAQTSTAPSAGGIRNPWFQLVAGIVCMTMIANL
jgi:hypothetical protein